MNKQYKPNGCPDFFPYLIVKDAEASLKFYEDAFGFKVISVKRDDDNNKIMHVEIKRGEIMLMFCPEGAMGINTKSPISNGVETSLTLYCYCENVDQLYSQAMKHGAKSEIAPEDMFWGDRMCSLLDLDNYKWAFSTYIGEK